MIYMKKFQWLSQQGKQDCDNLLIELEKVVQKVKKTQVVHQTFSHHKYTKKDHDDKVLGVCCQEEELKE